jgi:putative ABC transport system permease protein
VDGIAIAISSSGGLNGHAPLVALESWSAQVVHFTSGLFLSGGFMGDLRQAFRELRATPSFTIVAVLVLTLGIGATTAIFSVVDAVVLRALPFDEHDRLVAIGERRPPAPGRPNRDPEALEAVAPQNYTDWVAQQQVFESIAAVAFGAFTFRNPGGEPDDLRALRVTAAFFDVLRIRPALGRTFTVENEVDGRNRVAVVSDAMWRSRFGGNPEIVGRTIALDDHSYEIVGVMPADTTYPLGAVRPPDVWVPYVIPPNERIRRPGYAAHYLHVIARLKPGVSIEQAQAQMDQVAAAIEQANPELSKAHKVGVRPLRDHVVGASTRSWMLMLLGTVAIVLLIACANVANLLLARASTRQREVAVRVALGAGRWRLIRQFMVESLVLSTAGTLLATILAWWAVPVLRNAVPDSVPRVAAIALDLRVLMAAAGLALFTGLLFGIVPALLSSKPDLVTSLKDETRGVSAGRGRQRIRGALVVAEVALALVLLVGAALFIGSFVTLMRIDPGFSSERVLTAQIRPRFAPGEKPPDSRAAFAQIVERLRQRPGVVHAAIIAGGIPLSGSMFTTDIKVPGTTIENDDRIISIRVVTPDYHRALRIPLRKGRLLEPTDGARAPKVVIINESAARKYLPAKDPIGRAVIVNDEMRTVVGVVGDVHQSSLETEPRTEVYVPMAQSSSVSGELVIRTSGDPYAVLPDVKSTVFAVLPDVPLRNVQTMDELLARRVAQRRLSMLMLGLFGVLGLVISAIGIYGVLAYLVSQRTREIGIRMALGATRATIVTAILVHATVLVVAGLVIGSVGAWYLGAVAKAFLFRVEPTDPRAFAAALTALSLSALVASLIPATRASGVDPIVALRSE